MHLKYIQMNERAFSFTHNKIRKQMQVATKKTRLSKIRVHDLRHSHASLLIDPGFPAPAIAERIWHVSVSITYTCAHLFPARQHDISNALGMKGIYDKLPEGNAENTRRYPSGQRPDRSPRSMSSRG